MAPDISRINRFLQERLSRERMACVSANEAAQWLDAEGLLTDSEDRPGLPLRNLLRDGRIEGQVQIPPRSNGRWWIRLTGI